MHVLYQPARGARSPSLCSEAVKVWNRCTCNQIVITATYIPGVENVTVGHTQWALLWKSQVGDSLHHTSPHISAMGHPSNRPGHHRGIQEMCPAVLQILGGCPSPSLVVRSAVCVPPDSLMSWGNRAPYGISPFSQYLSKTGSQYNHTLTFYHKYLQNSILINLFIS